MIRKFFQRVICGKKQRVQLNADERMIKDIKSCTLLQVAKLACGVCVVGRLVHEERAKVTGKQFMIFGRDQESGMDLVSNALRGPINYRNADSNLISGDETFNTKFERNVTIAYSYLDHGTSLDKTGVASPTTPDKPSPNTPDEQSSTTLNKPSPTTSGGPFPTTPGGPSSTTLDKPSQTTPDKPSPTTSGGPSPTTPGGPSPTTPGQPSSTTPDKPSPTTPYKPSPTTPDKPSPTTPDKPSPTTSGGTSPFTPDKPSSTTPTKPFPTTPDKPSQTTPDEPYPATPGELSSTPSCGPSPTTPDKPLPTTHNKPSPTTPDGPSPTTPCEPSPSSPGDPSPIKPGDESSSPTAVKADYAVIYCIPITQPFTNENNENYKVLQTLSNKDLGGITVAFTYSDRLLGTTDDYIKTLPEQFHTFSRKKGNNYIFISSSMEDSKKNESNVDNLIKRFPSQSFGLKLGVANILYMLQPVLSFRVIFICLKTMFG